MEGGRGGGGGEGREIERVEDKEGRKEVGRETGDLEGARRRTRESRTGRVGQ